MSIYIETLRDLACSGHPVCDEVADELESCEQAYASLFSENGELKGKCEALREHADTLDAYKAVGCTPAGMAELRASLAAREKDVLAMRDALQSCGRYSTSGITYCDVNLINKVLADTKPTALAIEQRIRDSALEEAALVADAEWRSIPQQGNGIYISLVATVQRVGAAIRALKGTK